MDGAFPSERGQSFDGFTGDTGFGRGQRRGFRGTAENAKTKLCLRWLAGECRFGTRCNFAHGEHELRKLPPKGSPSRFSQDRERESREKERGRGRSPYAYGGSVSLDSGYRPMTARPSMYEYRGGGAAYGASYANGANPYSRVYGPPVTSGYGPIGRGAGPIHVTAPSPNPPPREFYAVHGYPVPGPNGWTMYRDPESGEPYYHNHHTNVTQWSRPPEWLQ